MGLFDGLATGLLGGVAGLIGGGMNSASQAGANEMSLQMMRENEGWQYNMSNSAYQRATQDMVKAGLNPMLAYSQGGASTPTPGQPSIQSTQSGQMVTGAVSGALDALKANEQLSNIQADTLSKTANAAGTVAEVPEKEVKGQVYKSILPAVKVIGDRIQSTASSAKQIMDAVSSPRKLFGVGGTLGPSFNSVYGKGPWADGSSYE